ncbi:hypothetical protein [Hymenobacter weizhouensis]|uniref:hypothetical protein n=1 Tax=Hymenobacter sp. YIM 151500-1 TaxID=2987689 RepID=UPI0022268B0B|nr:hypothetical protein [Hymenobacter sp. YIM 151500-1]UYZ62318.1 hypothetical protein OIS53_15125 [Hymenobacter sp. YIM 151500-1]
MAALGILLIWFIYALLGAYSIYFFIRWRTVSPLESRRSYVFLFGISVGLLILFGGSQYYNHQIAAKEYIGVYSLSAYPNCPTCQLYLKADNYYEVRQEQIIKERGPWRYESGGDYWIVYINTQEQLGSGPFQYTTFKAGE